MQTNRELICIETKGTPFERGRQQGDALRNLIREGLETYCSYEFAEVHEGVLDNAGEYIAAHFHFMTEEMEGIAAGAGVTFREILRLNAFNAVLNAVSSCDTLVVADEKGKVLLGGNIDIDETQRKFLFVHRTKTEDTEAIMLQWAGNLWALGGINSHGLACSSTSAPVIPGGTPIGLPQHMTLYPVLLSCCDTFAALDRLSRTRLLGKGLNIGLADAAGNTAMVEKSSSYQGVSLANGVTLFRTNHFLTEEMRKFNTDTPSGNSHQRFDFLKKALDRPTCSDPYTLLRSVLKSHGEGGLCQHAKDNMDTLASFVIHPGEGWMEICGGRPCCDEYIRYKKTL